MTDTEKIDALMDRIAFLERELEFYKKNAREQILPQYIPYPQYVPYNPYSSHPYITPEITWTC